MSGIRAVVPVTSVAGVHIGAAGRDLGQDDSSPLRSRRQNARLIGCRVSGLDMFL